MSWTDRFFENRTVIGIEVILTEENRIFNYSVVKRTKDTFEVLHSSSNIQEIEPKSFPQTAPVCVAVNGKGIIHKKIYAGENAEDRALLSQILPAANPEDFFLQKVKASGDSFFVSVIRKNIITNILEKLKEVLPKNEIVSLTLGPFCVLKVLQGMEQNHSQNEIRFANHYLMYLTDGTVHEYLSENNVGDASFKFNSLLIPEKNLVSFSAAYKFFTGSSDYEVGEIPSVLQAKKRLKEKKNFELTLAGALGFFLIVLIVNYFLFDHYWNKKNELSTLFALNQDAFLKLEKLKADYSEKQNFLQATGFFEASRLSYYADQLALDLPENILLVRLNLNPLTTKINDKEIMTFSNKKIDVSGTCKKSTQVNEWIKSLKQKPWVEDLVMINYTYDKSRELADFTIEITAKSTE